MIYTEINTLTKYVKILHLSLGERIPHVTHANLLVYSQLQMPGMSVPVWWWSQSINSAIIKTVQNTEQSQAVRFKKAKEKIQTAGFAGRGKRGTREKIHPLKKKKRVHRTQAAF